MKRMAKATIKTKLKPKHKKETQSTLAKRTKTNQNRFLNALIRNKYHVTKTCEETGISRMTYYDWTRKNPKFKAKMEDLREQEIDTFEDAFRELIEDRNPAAVMFGLKTRGRHRGYIDRQEVEHSGSQDINFTIHQPKQLDHKELKKIEGGDEVAKD